MKKCLVLGANGFIGKNLCARLVQNYEVRAFDKFNCAQLLDLGVHEIVEGDYLTMPSFDALLDGVDTVYHLISTTLPKDGSSHIIDEEINQNVVPTLRLLESMKRMGTKTIVFASSGGTIYGDYSQHPSLETDPLNPKCSYGLQKQIIEDCLNFYRTTCGIQARTARISNPYGIGQQSNRLQGIIPIFLDHLLKDEPVTLLGVDSHRNYIYMDDVTEALVRIGAYEGNEKVFNIGSRDVCSLSEIVSIMEDVVGKKFRDVTCLEQRSFDVDHSQLDCTLARKELGWSAKISVKHGIQLTYQRMLELAAAQTDTK